MRLSKLSNFENPSFSFRIQYALYTSPVGQFIHNYFIKSHHDNHRQSHSVRCERFENFDTFSVYYLPFLEDNYSYFLIDHETGETAVVDPADADLVIETYNSLLHQSSLSSSSSSSSPSSSPLSFPSRHPLHLTTILCTHKHMDHAGGNTKLKQHFPQIRIVSGSIEQVASQSVSLSHQDILQLGSTSIQLLETPCHTVGHVVFFVSSSSASPSLSSSSSPLSSSLSSQPSSLHTNHTSSNQMNSKTALFSGDILFVGGCGRFFEGNGTVMLSTLQLIRSLPLSTAIFCGHEYTVNNLAFCLLIDPSNEILQRKYSWAKEQRQLSRPTIPSLLSEEMEYNVFLRYDQRQILEVVEKRLDQQESEGEGGRGGEGRGGGKRNHRQENDERKVMIAKSSHVLILEELRRWRNSEA